VAIRTGTRDLAEKFFWGGRKIRDEAIKGLHFCGRRVTDTGSHPLAQASVCAVDEGTQRPIQQSRPARLATAAERQKHEFPECRAADLILTHRTRAGDRIEAVAYGIIGFCAAGAIGASFSASFRLIQNWQSFVTFVESVLK